MTAYTALTDNDSDDDTPAEAERKQALPIADDSVPVLMVDASNLDAVVTAASVGLIRARLALRKKQAATKTT